jgi:hypothetical protein
MTTMNSSMSAAIATAGATFETPRFGLVARLKALFAPVKPQSESEVIGDFIQSNGGVLTDDLEREISRRYGSWAGR